MSVPAPPRQPRDLPVIDTSAFVALHDIKALGLLPHLFGRVLVPEAVRLELAAKPLNPDPLALPWVNIVPTSRSPALAAYRLGKGEHAVLSLMIDRRQGVIAILDDNRGRKAAKTLGLNYTGVLGVLLAAKRAGLIAALAPYVQGLEDLVPPFYMDEALIGRVLTSADEDGAVIRLNPGRGRKGPKRS